MEAAGSSETLLSIYRNDCNLNFHRRGNLRSHINCEVRMSEYGEPSSVFVPKKHEASHFRIYMTRNFALCTGNLYDTDMREAMNVDSCRILWQVLSEEMERR
jgi:hypothetical protein